MTTEQAAGLREAIRKAHWTPQALDAALLAEAPVLRDVYLAYALRHVQAEVAAILFGLVDDETFERVAQVLGGRAALAATPDPAGHDVRGHFPYHEYPHPTDHTHAATPDPAGLDVERLRKAMDVVVPESIPPLYWTNERLARAIAAEYTRLREVEG